MNAKLRNLILWSHSRETSVYVVFCLMIVAFIFLTPSSWFEKRERLATQTSRLIVQRSDFSPDNNVMRQKIRELSGDPNAEIVAVSERTNTKGEKIYEIEIK